MNLKSELKEFAKKRGIDLIGFGSPERMNLPDVRNRPADFTKEVKTIISLGVSLPSASLENLPATRRQFHNSFKMVNDKLENISYEMTILLEKKGYNTIPFPAEELGEAPELSNNLAAVAAGSGEFSVSGLVLTPEYGPRARFTTIFTSASIKPDPLMNENLCIYPECRACMDSCPAHAISSTFDFDKKNSIYGNLIRELCHNYQSVSLKGLRCGLCLNACPVGRMEKTSESKNLNDKLKDFGEKLELDLLGVASLDNFKEAPDGHAPQNYLKNVKSIISIGVRLPEANIQGLPMTRREYQMSFLMASKKINRAGFELEKFLESKGYKTIAMGDGCELVRKGSNRYEPLPHSTGLVAEISNSHAAVAAGLGEFGKSGLFLSKKFGPKVRLNTVLTEAPLSFEPVRKLKLCTYPECINCIKVCPPRAIVEAEAFDRKKGCIKGLIKEKCYYYQNVVLNGYRCGLCIKVCPAGYKDSPREVV